MFNTLFIIIGIILIAIFVSISAIFSSSEMAFISINRASISDKSREGNRRAQILIKLLKKPNDVISAIVICNNLVNISASILAGALITNIFGDIGIGLATALMFFILLIFGEVAPKAFGFHNEKLALRVAKLLAAITRIFHPLVRALSLISNRLIDMLGEREKYNVTITEKEILSMMRLGEAEGTIQRDEREMVHEVFEFDETPAYKVYTPKEKIIGIQEDEPLQALITKSIETGFSRFPLYRRDIDDIIGMVHIKDTLIIEDKTLPVKNIRRDILRIQNPNMKVDDILREMKRLKIHLAVVLSTDGKTIGLVSMEDLIEEIFGEILDEHDKSHLQEKITKQPKV
jgi:putative hemolysin